MAGPVVKTARTSRLGNFWLRAISPLSWPLGLRRVFLIALPLSFPLYLLLLAALLVLLVMRAIVDPVVEFWSAPPEKLRNDYYYSYERRRKRRRQTDLEIQDELPLDD